MKRQILSILALVAFLCMGSEASAQFQGRMTPNDTLQSVRVLPDGSAVFSIYAPEAQNVRLSGDIVPWGKPLAPEQKDGVWSFHITDVKPGAYRYNFVVDGVTVYDLRMRMCVRDRLLQ